MFIKSSDGVNIYYRIHRTKKPFIVLLHGMALDSDSFNNIDLKGYSTLAIDFRGHGKSGKPYGRSYYTLEKCVSDVKQVLSRENIKSFSVIGFSMGGYVAARLSNELKSVKKVVLINPVLSRGAIKFSFIFEAFVSLFAPRAFLKLFVRDVRVWVYRGLLDEYAKLLINTPRRAYWSFLNNSINFKKIIPRKDAVIIKSSGDEIVNKGSLTYEIKGHHHVLAENPDEVNEVLKRIF